MAPKRPPNCLQEAPERPPTRSQRTSNRLHTHNPARWRDGRRPFDSHHRPPVDMFLILIVLALLFS
eukprot:8672107-Pyramimonas_sp.AAC.1